MAGKTAKRAAAKKKTAKKSAKVVKKAAAKAPHPAAKPTLLAGGNPQIAKAEGDVDPAGGRPARLGPVDIP